jgi:hypothetical protein
MSKASRQFSFFVDVIWQTKDHSKKIYWQTKEKLSEPQIYSIILQA